MKIYPLCLFSFCLMLSGCLTSSDNSPPATSELGCWHENTETTVQAPIDPQRKQSLIQLAQAEWRFFGKQTLLLEVNQSSIPHLGFWQDDDQAHSDRVNLYWQSVGRPHYYGTTCQQPWSAAFISWLMQQADIPENQFVRSEAHWHYIVDIMQQSHQENRFFVPRDVTHYSPEPGDLICFTRARGTRTVNRSCFNENVLQHKPLHCDIVIRKQDRQLWSIGGNVRKSVTQTQMQLDEQGHLDHQLRPWLIILQNQL